MNAHLILAEINRCTNNSVIKTNVLSENEKFDPLYQYENNNFSFIQCGFYFNSVNMK